MMAYSIEVVVQLVDALFIYPIPAPQHSVSSLGLPMINSVHMLVR